MSAYDVINAFYIAGIILFVYSSRKNTLKVSLLEFFTAFLFGLVFETYNIQQGHYSYPNSYFYIGKVSVSVLIGWYTVFMLGKYFSQSILYFYTLARERKEKSYHFIPFIIILTGLIGSTFSYIIDPIATRTQWWVWYEPTPFLDVPIGELYGIFIATCTVSIVFWILYLVYKHFTRQEMITITLNGFRTIDFIPFTVYEILVLLLGYWSYSTSLSNGDVLIGSVVTIIATQIIVFIWLLLYIDNIDEIKVKIIRKDNFIYISVILILLGAIFVFLSLIIILFSITLPFFNKTVSIHMILFSFGLSFVLLGFGVFLKKQENKN